MRNTKKGFTLIELLIVIAIIGILAAVLIPNLLRARARANDSAAQSYARNCYTAVEVNRDADSNLPTETSCMVIQDLSQVPPSLAGEGKITYDFDGKGNYKVDVDSVTGNSFEFDGK